MDRQTQPLAQKRSPGGSRTLGIVVPDTTIRFFAEVVCGAEAAARERGYTLMVANSGDNPEHERRILSVLGSGDVEGVLLVAAAAPTSPNQAVRMIETGVPVVCVDRIPERIEIDSVSTANDVAAGLGVDHLLGNGYRRIAILTGPLFISNEQHRLLGYRESLRRAGIAISESMIWSDGLTPDDAEAMCRKELSASPALPDALFCTNGLTALGALRCLRDRGLRIPQDMGFATFDELTPAGDIFSPGITTVTQQAYAMGLQALEILIGRIHESGDRSPGPCAVRLPASLIARESSRRQ